MKINKWLLTLTAACMITMVNSNYSKAQTAGPEASKTTAETSVQKATIENSIDDKTQKQDFAELNGKTGVVTFSRVSEENLKNLINKYFDCKIEKFIYTESTSGCLAALKSGRADFILISDISANYIVQRNPEFKFKTVNKFVDISMVLRSSDTKLKEEFNSALAKIKASGKSDELYKTWITDLPVGQEPSIAKIEKISDTAETVYVGISGDLPPLDYIAADGQPAGYNIALLAEISKIIGKNIEVVSIDSQARLTALEAKKIDVLFLTIKLFDDKATQEKIIKENDEIIEYYKKFTLTDSYCKLKLAFLLKK